MLKSEGFEEARSVLKGAKRRADELATVGSQRANIAFHMSSQSHLFRTRRESSA